MSVPNSPYLSDSGFSEALTDDPRKCQIVGCYKRHAYARAPKGLKVYSDFCTKHTCGRVYPEQSQYYCIFPRVANSAYCSHHRTCGQEGCEEQGEPLTLDLSDFKPFYCRKHRCAVLGCQEPPKAGDRERRCELHAVRCRVQGCSRSAYTHDDGRVDHYCLLHYGTQRCLYRDCTRQTLGSSFSFCHVHNPPNGSNDQDKDSNPCSLRGCNKSAEPNAHACSIHLCSVRGCPKPTVIYAPSSSDPPNTIATPYPPLCSSHICLDCDKPRNSATINAEYCSAHECGLVACRSRALDKGGHCSRHACSVMGCLRAKQGALSSSFLTVDRERERCEVHARVGSGVEGIGSGRIRASSFGAVNAGTGGFVRRYGGSGADDEALRVRMQRNRFSDDLERLYRSER
ncbi:uncharacterized protein C8A04DRAFT_12650 [Dichotomopilus funicola]|uniref:Uncharacterized protein n=1 Tax=Dichotomopilus funicola TaxID=1934379 RepID=A0AAN6ZML2_9PEZI|nr:hypothetical protein C8A04DRAFT_12650 [Dichotomopilus funicola]